MNDIIKTYTIYKHTAPNGKAYIGCTSQKPEYRWNNGNGYRSTNYFQTAINEYEWENFKHEILITIGTKEMAKKAEEAMIVGYNTLWPNGYNENLGRKHSESFKSNQAIKMKGKNCFKRTDEMRHNMSVAHKGNNLSEEAKGKLSIGMKERKWFTNGTINVRRRECPEGFTPGQTKRSS